MKKSWLALALLLLAQSVAPAAESTRYVPPEGFAGRKWGELRSSFDRLPADPMGVAAAYILPQLKAQGTSIRCSQGLPLGPEMHGPYTGGCEFRDTLDRVRRNYGGGGFYVLSEYSIPEQGFRWGDEQDGVVIHPVVYQFCANWHSSIKKKQAPPNFDKINKLCGVRLMFQSESREQLAKLPPDHVTVYDRMLKHLQEKFGPPAHFSKRGQVIIQTEDEEFSSERERKFSIWRWCPAKYIQLNNDCKASVTLAIDPANGESTVLYSTPLLWEYAFARENNGFKGDRLFRLLHAKQD
jgi:hypothetical protein